VSVATARDQSAAPAACSSAAQALGAGFWRPKGGGAPPPRPRPTRKGAGYRSLPRPRLVRRTTPRRESTRFAAASPVKPRGGLCRNARPVEPTWTVAHRKISVPSASERGRGDAPRHGRQGISVCWLGVPGDVPA